MIAMRYPGWKMKASCQLVTKHKWKHGLIDNMNGVIIDMTTKVAVSQLDSGAEHVDPNKAIDCGLVYDLDVQDYMNYLLVLNYTNSTMYMINRVLTNVVNSPVYCAAMVAPSGMKVNVKPAVIYFTGLNSKAKFKMAVEVHLGDAIMLLLLSRSLNNIAYRSRQYIGEENITDSEACTVDIGRWQWVVNLQKFNLVVLTKKILSMTVRAENISVDGIDTGALFCSFNFQLELLINMTFCYLGNGSTTAKLIYLSSCSHVNHPCNSAAEDQATYIIHVDKSVMRAPFSGHHDWYMSMLSSLSSQDAESPIHLDTYKHVLDGFSTVLSRIQVDQLEKMPGHVATFRKTVGKLYTMYTPKFLGLKKMKACGMRASLCNWKLIGACSFPKGMKQLCLNISTTDDYDSPRDLYGNGTHTSWTAGGSLVEDTEYFRYAKGSATGIAPKARLAMYQVLFLNYTYDSAATDFGWWSFFRIEKVVLTLLRSAGGTGAIFSTDFQRFLGPDDFDFPDIALSKEDRYLLKDYLIKTEDAVVDIKFQITIIGAKPAPMVVWFSSRGPDRRSPWILKPNVVAPGVDIVASWSSNVGMQPLGDNFLLSDFAIVSGTSKSSPHVVGMAVLIKAAHWDWSPAAIRSAMITTVNSKAQFKMTVEVDVEDTKTWSDAIVKYGFLSWNEFDGPHVVRSPIVSAHAPYVRVVTAPFHHGLYLTWSFQSSSLLDHEVDPTPKMTAKIHVGDASPTCDAAIN
ncbi:Subtilisin-like protease, fibronectin type-III domain [Dillenia turbinata]|uniref:Subtilisin-like protease, fibronectin type-III domain n=1 Tax=Dillenia turbinata TaxID=194707 RepID=A0AAN8UTG7_9MAGN